MIAPLTKAQLNYQPRTQARANKHGRSVDTWTRRGRKREQERLETLARKFVRRMKGSQ